jgi:gamma-glutamyl-gamma-aminobutyrate hydrolase PuuD
MARIVSVLGDGASAISAAAALAAAARASGHAVAALAAAPTSPGAPEHEFVAAHGAQWRSELALLEWATGRVLPPPGVIPEADLVIVAGAMRGAAHELAVDALGVALEGAAPRLVEGVAALAVPAAPPPPRAAATLRIGLLGTPSRLLRHYPAAMLALQEAVARVGLSLMPVFVPAEEMLRTGLPRGLDGLVLPGGADMGQVAAQVAAAEVAFAEDLPLLGLCLGMQSMTTAAMRRGGAREAMPEEVAGPGAVRSFRLLRDRAGAVRHRLGDMPLAPLPGTRLAALAPAGTNVRMHHRYAMDEALMAALEAGGLVVAARSEDGIAEAVEAPGRRFHLGLQGHPELGVDPGLAAIWDGFVTAAQTRRADHTPGRTEDATISP